MADVNAKIGVSIDASAALAELKSLQRQLAAFHSSLSKGSAASVAAQKNLSTNLLNSINATGKFTAQMGLVRSSTESFTHSLETNKLSMREYFRYAGGSTRTFGKLFKQEFNTIGKVAEERVKKMQTQYIKMGRDASGAIKAMSITPRTLDMNDYATKTALAAQKQALFNQLLKQGSTNLLNFGKNTQWAGRQLMVGFTIPLAYFGTAASKTFMDLEAQAIKFKRVYGDIFTTADETNKALKEIQLLAEGFTKYGVAVTKTMEMAAKAAAMGKTGADLTAQVAQATRLAVLGGVEQEQALETTISVTNAFGIAAEDLASKINFLNAVENQTVVSIEDLTVAIPKAGPVIKQLGGSVEDLAFFLTAMKEGGINASEGANALKSGLASLINPSKKASEMLAGFGVNIKAIVEGNQGNIRETVVDFAQALDTLDPLNRSRAIEQLFGKFQFSRLSTLFQNITKEGTQASKVLGLASASIEELAILSERELKTVENAIGTDFRESIEKLKVAIAPIGKTFLQAVTPMVKVIGSLLDKFDNLSEGTKKFIVVAGTLVGVIGPVLLMTFGLVLNATANIIKLFGTMRAGFLKSGASTKVLADQTNYLNSEQLEAATVATSLDQAHNRLTQSFTVEAVAVQALRKAYIDATVAAANFARTNPGMMAPGFRNAGPKKFASGTTGVVGGTPGKDSVPSLLMPGEAVIPTDTAQDNRYKPLVAALVTGKIKKYGKGTVSAGDDYTHIGGGRLTNIDDIIAQGRLTENEKLQAQVYRDVLKAAGKSPEARSYGSLALSFDPKLNKGLATRNGVSLGDFEKEWTSRPNKWAPSGLTSSQTQAIDSAMMEQIRKSPRVTDAVIENAFKNVPDNIKSTPAYQKMLSQYERIGGYSLGKGLGSTPQTSAQVLEQAKRAGIIKDFRVETRQRQSGATATKSLIVTTNDGKEVSLGRGSKANRIYFSDKSLAQGYQSAGSTLAVAKGEIYQTKDGKTGVVSGQTGEPKPSGRTITANPRDTRLMPTSNLARIFPYGVKGPRFSGAMGGAEDPSLMTGKSFSQTASGLYVPQSKLIDAIEKNTESSNDNTQNDKQSKKEMKAQRMNRMTSMAGPLSMAAGTAAMAGYATGNTGLGNVAMGVSGLAMIAPMLANPLGAAAAGLTALAASVVLIRRAFDSAQDSAMKMSEAMGSGDKAIQDLAIFSNRVSAGEIMDRRRGNLLNPFAVQTGKTTFGENFVKSETGKSMVSGVSESIKTGGTQSAQGQLLNQLATGIAAGAINPAQARSIAANIASEIGDYSFGISVNAKLIDLIGVNGENLMKDPLKLRVTLMEESRQGLAKQSKLLSSAGAGALTQTQGKVAAGASVAGGAMAGGLIGSVVPVVGTAIGAAIGAVVAGGVAYFAQKGQQEKLGRASGANVAMQKMALEQSQQMQDSLRLEYEQRIANAKAAGDTVKAIQLQNEYQKANTTLLEQNGKLVTDIQNTYKNSSGAVRGALETGLDKQITSKYKDTAMADIAPLATDLLDGSSLSKEAQFTLKMQLASGQMDPMQIVNLIETFGQDSKTLTKVMNIVTKFGGAFANQAMSVVNLFQDKNGNPLKEQQTKFIADISGKTSAEAEKYLKLFADISRVGNVMDVEVALTYYSNNPIEAAKLQSTIDKINEQKGKIDLEIATKILGAKEMEALRKDQEYFSKLPPEQQKVYLQTLTTIANIEGNNAEAIQNWLTQNPGKTEADYYVEAAQKITKISIDNTIPGGNKNVESGNRDTTFDDILINLKRTRDATIDVTKGAQELKRVLGGNKDIKIFNGIDQQLASLGANTDFIDWVGGAEKAIQNKLIKVAKDGIVTITALGKAAQKAFDEKALGLFNAEQINAINGAQAQRTAFVRLTAAGVNQAQALELVADANLAIAISRIKDIKELEKWIETYKTAKNLIDKTARQNDPITAFRNDMAKISEMLDVQEQQARAKYQPEIDRVNGLIEANEKAIEAKQRYSEITYDRPIQQRQSEITELNHDLSLIEKTASVITEKYDKQRKALEQVYSINQRIADQQKAKISLADALTSGDISQAAQIVEDIRSQEQTYAKEESLNALEIAQTKEINALRSTGGLSKLQIEEKIYTLGEEIYALEQKQAIVAKEILTLQDANYNLKVGELAKAEALLDNEIKLIEKQRLKYAEAELAIKSAEVKTDDYTKALERSEEVLKRMAILWATLGSKTSADLGAVTGAVEDPKDKVKDEKTGDKPPAKTNLISVTAKSGQTLSSIAKANNTTVKELLAINPVLTSNPKYNNGNTIFNGTTVKVPGKMYGGVVSGSGMLDKVPTMLTPGEFVMNRAASQKFGPLLERMNESKYPGSMSLGGTPSTSIVRNNSVNNRSTSVYNYSLNVGVNGTSASPDDIARTVITQIRHMDARRLRGNRY